MFETFSGPISAVYESTRVWFSTRPVSSRFHTQHAIDSTLQHWKHVHLRRATHLTRQQNARPTRPTRHTASGSDSLIPTNSRIRVHPHFQPTYVVGFTAIKNAHSGPIALPCLGRTPKSSQPGKQTRQTLTMPKSCFEQKSRRQGVRLRFQTENAHLHTHKNPAVDFLECCGPLGVFAFTFFNFIRCDVWCVWTSARSQRLQKQAVLRLAHSAEILVADGEQPNRRREESLRSTFPTSLKLAVAALVECPNAEQLGRAKGAVLKITLKFWDEEGLKLEWNR